MAYLPMSEVFLWQASKSMCTDVEGHALSQEETDDLEGTCSSLWVRSSGFILQLYHSRLVTGYDVSSIKGPTPT